MGVSGWVVGKWERAERFEDRSLFRCTCLLATVGLAGLALPRLVLHRRRRFNFQGCCWLLLSLSLLSVASPSVNLHCDRGCWTLSPVVP